MNNALIKELMFKAGDVPLPGLTANFDDNSWIVKYTVLIVRECTEVCRTQPNEYAMELDRENCASAIEDHFGAKL